jgi:hypothetical protein
VKIFLIILLLANPVWALTAAQETLLRTCYVTDADVRGKDARAQVQELIDFILLGRTAQKTQLTNLLQRCRDRISANQSTISADQAAALSALNQSGTDTDATLSGITTLP